MSKFAARVYLLTACIWIGAYSEALAQAPPRLPETADVAPDIRASLGEQPGAARVTVPFPGSLGNADVVANIKAIARQTGLAAAAGIPELDMTGGDLIAKRILQVTDLVRNRPYLVVELASKDGRPVANVTMTRQGVLMMAEDVREDPDLPRSMDLSAATEAVAGRLQWSVEGAEYVCFGSVAEPGLSFARPLAVVRTLGGAMYVNSRGDMFVEDGSYLAYEFDVNSKEGPAPAGIVLRPIETR